MDADLYVPGNGWLHRADPRVKFALSLALLVMCLIWRNWAFMLAMLVLEHVMLAVDHVPAERIAWVWRTLALLIVLIVALWPVFDPSGTHEIWRWGILRFTRENLVMAAVMGLRIPALGFACFLTLFTTSQPRLIRGLVALGMPYRAGLTLATSLRYIPVFFQIFQSVSAAQRARGLDLNGGAVGRGGSNPIAALVARFKSYLPIIVAVLIRAYRMSQGVGWAMESRGLGMPGVTRTYRVNLRMRPADWLLLAATIAGTAAAVTAMITIG
ncbi:MULTISPECIES: energy-coupling factor transporter transmembrane component T family protein [Bifidobacterium]|uniref:energy-coupling factor transporter transmembrane component T family protein n=1 Tax=Bifidobacterium TaxID=1678 RepID=UPI001BDCFC13|nr:MULTISPECIES: energy-coupling factor transporter transmembrane component T [Bifidobacterium]MBT1160960.1 energy-coupling factor transporter transmembrane protein EcfT [Bifidobacterium sp. SO1]MBW3077626.1 energy-coupling factor transporter transmembrane protein EcfT [Bifidobacterium simiiventris]